MTGPSPFLVRVAKGDIVDVRASVIAVSHINGVAPTGAQKAIDDLLGGAISRRMARVRGKLGDTWFIPTLSSPLAAGCVLIVGLGDAEHFTADRLGEVGAAIADAAATIGAGDVATVVHGTSNATVGVVEAAKELLSGVLDARRRVPGGDVLRELIIVEHSLERLEQVRAGVEAAATVAGVHVYARDCEIPRRVITEAHGVGTPLHLRLGLTRLADELKVSHIGDGAFRPVFVCPFPAQVAEGVAADLAQELLRNGGGKAEALQTIGQNLWNAFLGVADLDVDELVEHAPDGLIVLALDGATADLPWELLCRPDGLVVSRKRAFARQLEVDAPGRAAAFNEPSDTLRALVIGNPTNDLPAAGREAEAVARALEEHAEADVDALIDGVTYGAVTRMLNRTSYDVVHYAGHARFVDGRPHDSGLVLRDDKLLTGADFATRRYVPRLVVANGCFAARDTPDDERRFAGSFETRSLVAGVLTAGARAFIGAQWAVQDEAAATWARAFYTAVAPVQGGPKPIGEAVALAREAVAQKHGDDEDTWAAYALYGSPWLKALDVPEQRG